MSDRFELDPRLAADTFLVGETPLSRVLLMNDRQLSAVRRPTTVNTMLGPGVLPRLGSDKPGPGRWARNTKHYLLTTVIQVQCGRSIDRLSVVVRCSGTELIFPFSENWPANYYFSMFSKLPTNYPIFSEEIQLPHQNIPLRHIFRYVLGICSEMFG